MCLYKCPEAWENSPVQFITQDCNILVIALMKFVFIRFLMLYHWAIILIRFRGFLVDKSDITPLGIRPLTLSLPHDIACSQVNTGNKWTHNMTKKFYEKKKKNLLPGRSLPLGRPYTWSENIPFCEAISIKTDTWLNNIFRIITPNNHIYERNIYLSWHAIQLTLSH